MRENNLTVEDLLCSSLSVVQAYIKIKYIYVAWSTKCNLMLFLFSEEDEKDVLDTIRCRFSKGDKGAVFTQSLFGSIISKKLIKPYKFVSKNFLLRNLEYRYEKYNNVFEPLSSNIVKFFKDYHYLSEIHYYSCFTNIYADDSKDNYILVTNKLD